MRAVMSELTTSPQESEAVQLLVFSIQLII